MAKQILVTGINGFVGHHLALEIKNRGYDVVGIGQEPVLPKELASVVSAYYSCDLTKPETVAVIPMQEVQAVINLAGLANVGASFQNPDLYKEVNVKTLTTLGDLIKKHQLAARIVAVSTGAVYDASGTPPFSETAVMVGRKDTNPYVISKLLMEEHAEQYVSEGIDCVVVRPFNHVGPGQFQGFLLPDLSMKIKAALLTNQPLITGNLTTKRDYTDVRDVAKAYCELALASHNSLHHYVYNVCSGKAVSGTEILDMLLKLLSPHKKLQVRIDESLIRPNDPAILFGDRSRLSADTGWQPTISLEQTVRDIVASST